MAIVVVLRAGGLGNDVYLRPDRSRIVDVYLWPGAPQPNDVYLRREGRPLDVAAAPSSPFPTQYAGLRMWHSGAMVELCLVATADAPTGMGGQPRVRKGGTTYAMYLVETTDADASPFRIRTSAGTKSVRLKT